MQKVRTFLLLMMILLASESSNASENGALGLIAHGEVYDPDEYPYIVSLEISAPLRRFYCTGSLITPLFVLTAAHCTQHRKANAIKVLRYEQII